MSNKVKLMEITDNLLAQYNTDINGNIQAIHIIREQVVGSKDFSVVLGQIPDSQQGVAIINPDNFYEVFNYDDLTEQSYYRKDRRVYFHPSMSGKTVKVDYYGIGIDLISASSIYTQIDEYGNIIQTLEDMFEVGKIVVDALSTIGDTVTIIQQLKDTNIESANLLRQISNAITELKTTIKAAGTINNTLNTTINTGNSRNTEWNKTITSGSTMNSTLVQTTKNADSKNTQLNNTIQSAENLNQDLVENQQQAAQINNEIIISKEKGQKVLDGLNNSEISTINTNLKRFSPVPNNDIMTELDKDFCKNLKFNLRSVITKPIKNDLLFYKDNFTEFVNKEGSELTQIMNIDGENGQWTTNDQGLFCFRNTYGETESLMKYFINPKFSNCRLSVRFNSLNNHSSIRCGLVKDDNNWILANVDGIYDKFELITKKNGVFQSFPGISVPEGWKNLDEKILHFFCFNNVCIVILEYNKRYHLVVEKNIIGLFDLTNSTILSDFNLGVGVRIKKDQNGDSILRILEMEAGYTGGLNVGADFKALTYEDGSVIKKDNSIFFTSTTHLTSDISGNGTNIYSMDLDTYDINLVSKICGRINNKLVSCGASKVFYDRNKLQWVIISTNFNESPVKSYLGISDKNLLSGIHIIDMNYMNIPSGNNGTWDVDCIFAENTYILIYTSNGDLRKIIKASSSDLVNWSLDKQIDSTQFGEGNVITKIGGRLIVTHVANKTGLEMRDLYTLDLIDNVKCNIWSGNQYTPNTPMPWGCIMPIIYKNRTEYILLAFSMRTFLGRTYGYGDLWVYDCDIINTKQEFKQFDMKYFC